MWEIIVILLQFGYILYKDWSFNKERESMQLKIMSKDVHEYKEVSEPEPKPHKKEKQNEYIDVTEVSIDKLLQAEDGLW